MPLQKMERTTEQSGWAVWFISESVEELESLSPEVCPAEVVVPLKKQEWLAGRILLKTLVEQAGLDYRGLRKDGFGKPFLNHHPHPISLSHSFPYVAAQIDSHQSVGIDLEYPKEKLLRIASRVMANYELVDAGQDVLKHCVYWCAKEALYKVYGKRGLIFSNHLNIEPFQLRQAGELNGRIEDHGTTLNVRLYYSVQPEYVLVYTKTGSV